MAQLREGLALDLADALARDAELAADLLERARVAVEQAEAELDDLLLTLGERVEDVFYIVDDAGKPIRDCERIYLLENTLRQQLDSQIARNS